MARFTGGWIKLHRQIIKKDLGEDLNLLGLFVWMLMAATIEDTTINWKGKPREIEPGYVVFGILELANKFGVSRSVIYRRINYLETRQTISFESSTTGCLIKINKFKEYQIRKDNDGTTARQQRDNDGTLNEEVQEGKNKYSPEFLAFWEVYPRHEAKPRSFKAFKKLSKTLQVQVTTAAKNYDAHCKRKNTKTEHTLLASTFINEERWRDYLTGSPGFHPKPVVDFGDSVAHE